MRITICIVLFFQFLFSQAQNALVIPPTLSGTNFNLNIQEGTTQFVAGINTPTYGINGSLLAPTLILNKWDWVTMDVTNNLTGNGNSTTIHWHGLHVPAMADGGPHQIILQNSTWSPQFQILNNAATFWYHPHGDNKTDRHVSKGIAGMIIVKDSAEAALNLPRTYGTDDFPIIVQTKAFDVLHQIAIASALDTLPMVNGTVDPFLNAPAQVVRLRLLNGASDRTFMFGFSNNMNFHLIATDGGLIDSSVTLNRLRLSNGERAEILVDLSSLQSDSVYLMNYGSEIPTGIIGAAQVGNGMASIPEYDLNPLNGADFNLLKIKVVAPTANPITTIPTALIQNTPWQQAQANTTRNFLLAPEVMGMQTMAEGPFTINGSKFSMDTINITTYLNNTEVWTLNNQTLVAHPFHIHDMHFYILNVNGGAVPNYERGKKDVVLVMPMQTVSFITKFETFADATTPYMYHCHLLHHEDDGMMGSFIVLDTNSTGVAEINSSNNFSIYPNPTTDFLNIVSNNNEIFTLAVFNSLGEKIHSVVSTGNSKLETGNFPNGMYFLKLKTNTDSITQKFIKQ
ncbi:MAG: multicopper oxidase domain-containing protein [Chitinophagales bacterium]|jgi:blue copper oxidase|nr:multicopper oxidase domain-containing protein [Chitinophagales bacterium]